MTRLDVGDILPDDITLPDADGNLVRLADHRGNQNLVLYFYPKDDTPGCTTQACTFRDLYADFLDQGAQVYGVSHDGGRAHAAFAQKYNLPFPLLSDRGGALRRRLGVPKSLGFIPGRVTYVIDKEGVVRHVFNSQSQAAQHVHEALQVLESLP